MATNRTYRPHRSRLTADQERDLWLGPGPPQAPAFASEEARQAAWLCYRDNLLSTFSSAGRRPQAWWQYDAPIPYPGYERERSTLYQAELLGDDERVELEVEWRRAFDWAQRPDFSLCLGQQVDADDELAAHWLEGTAARRAYYRDVDIPRALVRKWTAERKRAAQTIRRLEDGSFTDAARPDR
jgi:hypothetical protein